MEIKHTLIVLFLFVYSVAFGQQSKNKSAQVDVNQREQISQLRAENDDLKKQLYFMEKKIEHEEKVVDDLKGEITFWFSFVSILVTAITMVVAIIGVVLPFYNMREIKKKQKEVEAELEKQRNQTIDLQTLAESAKEQATLATQAAKEAKNSSEHMQTQVEYVSAQAKLAEQAANDAKAIQIFVLALKEPNPENALHFYDILINEYDSFYGICEAYFQRGIIKYKLNDLDGAIYDFDKVISINQDYAMAYCNRGLLKYKLNDFDGAMADYDEAIRIDSKYAEAYCGRGDLKRAKSDLIGSMSDYDEAIKINPNYAVAYCNRGLLKYQLNDLDGAISDCDEAIRISPSAEAYCNRGLVKSKMNDFDGAMSDFEEAIRIDCRCAMAYQNRGCLKLMKDDLDGAMSDLNQAISISSDDSMFYSNRAKCYRKLAENGQDPDKKADYIAKAEADEKTAEGLKQKGK